MPFFQGHAKDMVLTLKKVLWGKMSAKTFPVKAMACKGTEARI